MTLAQFSSGSFSDLSGSINTIFNFLSEVDIFAILLNMQKYVISSWSSQWSSGSLIWLLSVLCSFQTTPRKDSSTSKYSGELLGMQTRITLVLKDLPAVCRLLHDCISQNDRISNFVDISNFVVQKYSKFLWLQIKGQIIYSLTGICKTLKTVFWSISKI